jgi:hypothetical protein
MMRWVALRADGESVSAPQSHHIWFAKTLWSLSALKTAYGQGRLALVEPRGSDLTLVGADRVLGPQTS